MALEVPETFLSESRRAKKGEEPLFFRLAEGHRQDLRDVACGVEESDVGVGCTYLVDSRSGEGADYDEHALDDVERYADQAIEVDRLTGEKSVRMWRRRIVRCRRALCRMRERGEQREASVLYVAYGYPDPLVEQLPDLKSFGVLASLARYVDATEEKRQELVRKEAASSERRFDDGKRTRMGREWRGVDREADEIRRHGDERAQSGSEKARAALSLGLEATAGNKGVVSLAERRSRLATAERTITSADALRAALATFPDAQLSRGEGEPVLAFEARKQARKDREAAHRAKREAFLTQCRIECSRELSAAEAAYYARWREVAS